MDARNIDRTHIITLQKINGLFQNVTIPISRPDQFIAEFEAMKDNPNRTVWDMQSFFMSRFQKTIVYLNYIHPFQYNDSYVEFIRYPEISDYNDLQKSWEEAACSARNMYLFSCKQKGINPDQKDIEQAVGKAIEDLKRGQKQNYFISAMHWIDARCYYDTVNQINRNETVKMFSKENIGWCNFFHKINDDINIALKTNFGYGRAAYFLLAIQYKGLAILPYSYIVRYYNVGMADIVRCTRSYLPHRESWSASFDFLSDFVNKSIADPDGFVRSYIMREVTEMMCGLEDIARNPTEFLNRIGGNTAEPCVVNVRPMFSDEINRMKIYPKETAILFKVEKITGALEFLDSLKEIAKVVDMIQPHIDRLLEINMALYPEIQIAISEVGRRIEKQTLIKGKLEKEDAELSKELVPFEKEIAKLRAEATHEKPFDMSNYERDNCEYKKLRERKNNLQSRLYDIYRSIDDFNAFLDILNRSISKLDEIKQA